jgi:type II secretory pathway component PulK
VITNTKFQDERGIAMLIELLLVVAVLGIAGAAYYTANNHSKATPQAATLSTPSAVPNGSVDNAVTALIQDSSADDTTAVQEDANVPATDASSGTAQQASGSVDENSF